MVILRRESQENGQLIKPFDFSGNFSPEVTDNTSTTPLSTEVRTYTNNLFMSQYGVEPNQQIMGKKFQTV